MGIQIPKEPENKQIIDLKETYNTDQIVAGFDKTPMTIYHWRKHRGLPFIELASSKKPVIRFNKEKVIQWAKERDVPFNEKKAEKAGN